MLAAAWILLFPLVLLHLGSAQLLDPKCAKGKLKGAHKPWMASITTDTQQCIGSLINDRHVLTAAHCFKNTTRAHVRLGDITNSQISLRMFEEYYVQTVFIHYMFNATSDDNKALYDIALLRLPSKVVYKPHIQPICLWLNQERKIKSKKYALFPFGKKEEGPKKISIRRLKPDQCYSWFQFVPHESQICVVPIEEISCGESGTSLVKGLQMNGTDHYALLGIQNYGILAPCIYTNVMSYVDWIVENILDVKIVIPEIKTKL